MKMHEVRYFLALCEERNFTRAAKQCGVSQPSLTNAVKTLETKLGGLLFYRSQSETSLTELGKLVRPHMKIIYREAKNALETATSFTKKNSSREKRPVTRGCNESVTF